MQRIAMDMLVFVRDREYPELLGSVRGKRVGLWTCNTCARLCNGMGGTEAAERLAERLRSDGVEVAGVRSVSASCLEGKVRAKLEKEPFPDSDVLISLTCDSGSYCLAKVSEGEVVNPFVTLGRGYLSEDGVPVLKEGDAHRRYPKSTDRSDPFV